MCATCGQPPLRSGARHLLTDAIADYLIAREGRSSIGSIKPRLGHVTAYINETDRLATACEDVDADWIEAFREWAAEVPIVSPRGQEPRLYAWHDRGKRPAARCRDKLRNGRKDTLFPAPFAARSPEEVSRTPAYRADIKTLAAMFRYCVSPELREGEFEKLRARRLAWRADLHRFLQLSVATWARPDAVHEICTDRPRDQWHSNARALNLNQKGRAQTKRPIVPIGLRVAALLDANVGFYVKADSVGRAFREMQKWLGLPGDGETGLKLIRRSVAHIARQRLGERDWIEGQIMLGHKKVTTSDTYAPFDTGYLGEALRVTDEIIEAIEKLVPGAFSPAYTGLTPE